MVYPALDVAEELEKEGINIGVINGRFIKPMDNKMLSEVALRTKKILTLEENALMGGFGSGVMELLSKEDILIPIKSMGIPDTFITHGSQKKLRNALGIDREGIKKAIKAWLKKE